MDFISQVSLIYQNYSGQKILVGNPVKPLVASWKVLKRDRVDWNAPFSPDTKEILFHLCGFLLNITPRYLLDSLQPTLFDCKSISGAGRSTIRELSFHLLKLQPSNSLLWKEVDMTYCKELFQHCSEGEIFLSRSSYCKMTPSKILLLWSRKWDHGRVILWVKWI
jgi:hypothetical protein